MSHQFQHSSDTIENKQPSEVESFDEEALLLWLLNHSNGIEKPMPAGPIVPPSDTPAHIPMGQVTQLAGAVSNVTMTAYLEDQSALPGLGAATAARGLESAMDQQAGCSHFIDVMNPHLSGQPDAFETPCRGTVGSNIPSQSHLDESHETPSTERPRLGLGRVLYELQQYGILGSESYNGPVCFNCCGCHSLSCCPEEKVERVIRRNVDALFPKTIQPTTMDHYCVESTNSPSASMSIEEIVCGIDSGDEYQEMIATRAARENLCMESECPPLNILLRIPKLVQFLNRDSAPELQLEAAWSLAIIVSGPSEQTKAVVRTGATDKFISLLGSFSDNIFSNDFTTLTLKSDLVEPAMWALGSIAGDGPDLRDYVIEQGITKPLVSLIEHDTWSTLSSVSAWTLSNLCRKPHLSVPAVRKLLPALGILISHDDPETLHYSCWALAFLTDGPNEIIQEIVEAGLVPRLISLLNHNEGAVVTPVLKAIRNIAAGNELDEIGCVFAAGAI